MKVLITANDHRFYDRTGEANQQALTPDGRKIWLVQLDGGKLTTVEEGQFKEIKRQEP
jgi:hypothetical protein